MSKYIKTCVVCGTPYFGKRKTSQYCSHSCQRIDHYSRYDHVIHDWIDLYESGTGLWAISRLYPDYSPFCITNALRYAGVEIRPKPWQLVKSDQSAFKKT